MEGVWGLLSNLLRNIKYQALGRSASGGSERCFLLPGSWPDRLHWLCLQLRCIYIRGRCAACLRVCLYGLWIETDSTSHNHISGFEVLGKGPYPRNERFIVQTYIGQGLQGSGQFGLQKGT